MQRKRKLCKCGCGQEGYIWAKGMLKYCYYRTNPPKSIQKTTTPKSDYEPTGEMEVFDEIYIASDKRSFVSGEDLTPYAGKVIDGVFVKGKLYHWLFHHILNTKKYKRWILNKKNIILLTPQEHTDIHSLGKDKLLAMNPRWQLVFDMFEEFRIEYNQGK